MSLNDFDLWANQAQMKPEILEILRECIEQKITRLHLGGEDLDLREAQLLWEPTHSLSHPILGEIESSSSWGPSKKWYIRGATGKKRHELSEIKEAIKKSQRQRMED
jgi:hypothetical protein